ncbi:MAG: PrsW family glutamic-type intramembrane protease, partial [Spirochaetaceae bacterium]
MTGVVEEWAKWLCFIMAVHGGGTIKEPQDGILQAAAVGLGFGTVENIAYIARYPGLWIAIRPFVATGGHMIYAAFWGGFYSAAVYSNVQGRDPQAYRLAVGSVFLVALIHGSYNALLSVSFTLALLPDVVLLVASVAVFLHMVRRSPYRRFELSEAGEAIAALETGLAFNRKSTILNRRMGLYRMYRGEYTRAASYFARAIPRAKQPTSLRFFKAVCEYAHLGGTVGKNALRKAWAL